MVDLPKYRNIHCIGIGGIGLSAIADILIERGYNVSGSDMNESDITLKLAQRGARIFIGHRGENVVGADLIVYSAAIGWDNPELKKAEELGIPAVNRAELLGVLMDEYNNSIAIAGTHGKTTTTSMVSLILENAKVCPTILVGGNLSEIGGNVSVGKSDYFVTEACEYMDSFLQLKPKYEVILNIDSDHLDYFKDIDHIASSFEKFTHLVPKDGKIIAFDANPFVKKVTSDLDNVITFGLSEGCDYSAKNICFGESGMPSFEIYHGDIRLSQINLQVPGEHNILNALAAYACTHALGIDCDIISKTLNEFKGTQRRFDIVGTTASGVKIVDDYAHHPTEINATLNASQNLPHNRLWCIFQPHTFTRTIALYEQFLDSFIRADVLILTDIYAAREKNIYKVSSEQLAKEMMERHPDKEILFMSDFEEIANYVNEKAQKGDLVITMGAGDVYKIGEMLLEL